MSNNTGLYNAFVKTGTWNKIAGKEQMKDMLDQGRLVTASVQQTPAQKSEKKRESLGLEAVKTPDILTNKAVTSLEQSNLNSDRDKYINDKISDYKQSKQNVQNTIHTSVGNQTDVLQTVGQAANTFANSQADNSAETAANGVRSQVTSLMLKSGNPDLQAMAAIGAVADSAAEYFDVSADAYTKDTAETLELSKAGQAANQIIRSIPGLSSLGALVSQSEEFEVSEEAKKLQGSHGGAVNKLNAASSLGGGNYLFDRSAINNAIGNGISTNRLLVEMQQTNSLRKQNNYQTDLAQQNLRRYAGTNYYDTQIGKDGMRLLTAKEARELLIKPTQTTQIKAFAEGGKMNLLPEGALHARLNNLKETGEEIVEDVTKKGIPVITVDESGNIQQVAEIEKNELILTKELTDKIEVLRKDGSEEAMIEAGRLLAEELITNLDDKQGEITNE